MLTKFIAAKIVKELRSQSGHGASIDAWNAAADFVEARFITKTLAAPLASNRMLIKSYIKLVDAGKGEDVQAKVLRETINAGLGGIAEVPELADADAAIAFYDV